MGCDDEYNKGTLVVLLLLQGLSGNTMELESLPCRVGVSNLSDFRLCPYIFVHMDLMEFMLMFYVTFVGAIHCAFGVPLWCSIEYLVVRRHVLSRDYP